MIVPYQESWPAEFQEIAAVLRRGLGELALRIDHVGSTAVPGLAAKDVIDIQITVAALGGEVTAALIACGYSLPEGVWRDHAPPDFAGPDSEWEKLVFARRPASGARTPTCACKAAPTSAMRSYFATTCASTRPLRRLTAN